MNTSASQTLISDQHRALTRYIPLLLQALLLLTMWPYFTDNEMSNMMITKNAILVAAFLLMLIVATKARQQWIVTGLVCANTVVLSYVFGSMAPKTDLLPYPYFVILMMALLGYNVRHVIASVILLCAGYVGVLYQHNSLSQQYLLLVPVLAIMAALVTCHVFQAEQLATKAMQIQKHVDVDALTGLPNRVAFIDRVWGSIHAAGRFRDEYFAVVFIDLDGFKMVNDQLGHRAGDELLHGMASRVKSSLRIGDVVARYGGDEFCVLLGTVHSKKEATQIAERILDKVKMPIIVGNGRAVTVGASIGIAMSSNIHSRPEDLIRDADAAMYAVKQRGKNGIAVSDQMAELSSTSFFAKLPRVAHS